MGWWRARGLAYWIALACPGLVPLVAPYLPFQDWPGHIGVTAAMHWIARGEPLPEAYAFRGWVGPNRLSYAIAAPLVPLLGALTASNVLLALGLGGLGPAAHLAIRRTGGDPRWALLATPLALGRITACGFGPNAMALPLVMLVLGTWWSLDWRWRQALPFLAALLGLLGMHLFVFLAVTALLVAVSLVDLPSSRASDRDRGQLCLLLCAVALVAMKAVAFVPAPRGDGPSVTDAVLAAIRTPDLPQAARTYWDWTFAYFRTAQWDDLLQAGWMIALAVACGLGHRRLASAPLWWRLAAMIAASSMAFAVLDETIGPPVDWWGGNLRIPTLTGLLLVVLSSHAPPNAGRRARWLGAGSALAFVAVASWEIIAFSREEMAGFARVVAAVPPGTRVCSLHYTPAAVNEFPGDTHWYVSAYVLAEKPASVDHALFGNSGEPVSRPREIDAPVHGHGPSFDWKRHRSGCDGFLVRVDSGQRAEPFRGQARECVELKIEAGSWRYYQRTRHRSSRCAG